MCVCAMLCHPMVTVYSACVFSSIGSPGGSLDVLVATGRSPLRIDRRSEILRIRGNKMKSYKKPPIKPPIIGPTQYTWKNKRQKHGKGEEEEDRLGMQKHLRV